MFTVGIWCIDLDMTMLNLTLKALLIRSSIVIISIIRIKSIEAVSFTDPTFSMAFSIFWTNLEPSLCIINAKLPMVRTLFVDFVVPRVFGRMGGRGRGNGSASEERRSWGPRGMSLFESTRNVEDMERGQHEATTSTESQKSSLVIGRAESQLNRH